MFWRIVIFYILGILITGMLVPYDDPNLLNGGGTAAQSPYVIAIRRAGIRTLPSIINAAIFTSAFSAGNSYLFCSSRILYGLSIRGQAPRIFSYCTKNGLPIVAVLTCVSRVTPHHAQGSVLTPFLVLLHPPLIHERLVRCGQGLQVRFCHFFPNENVGLKLVLFCSWFVNLSTTAGFFTWWAINVTFIQFCTFVFPFLLASLFLLADLGGPNLHAGRGHRAQGRDRRELAYYNPLQPGLAIWGVFWTSIFILVNGYKVFFVWNTQNFLTAYINIPIFFGLWIGWSLYMRTPFWQPDEMDFVTVRLGRFPYQR